MQADPFAGKKVITITAPVDLETARKAVQQVMPEIRLKFPNLGLVYRLNGWSDDDKTLSWSCTIHLYQHVKGEALAGRIVIRPGNDVVEIVIVFDEFWQFGEGWWDSSVPKVVETFESLLGVKVSFTTLNPADSSS